MAYIYIYIKPLSILYYTRIIGELVVRIVSEKSETHRHRYTRAKLQTLVVHWVAVAREQNTGSRVCK